MFRFNQKLVTCIWKTFSVCIVMCLPLSTLKPFVCLALFYFSGLSLTMQLIKQTRLNSNSQNSVCLRFLVHICVPPHLGETFLCFSLILNIFCSFSGIALEKERSCARYLKTFSAQCLHTALGVISLSSYCSLRRQHRPGFAFILAYCSSF